MENFESTDQKEIEVLLYKEFIKESAIKKGMIQEKIAVLKAIIKGVRPEVMLEKTLQELMDYDEVVKQRAFEHKKIMRGK